MSNAAERAIEWLQAQVDELSSIRNATPRDPSFKNWRQATLTVMQRIWPGDQTRSERFRRIPFSPADPRSDLRAIREWYSRGCQEAGRVLNGFIDEIRKDGVPESAGTGEVQTAANEFEDGFPTVDLPLGELGQNTPVPAEDADVLPQGMDPEFAGARPQLPPPAPTPAPAPPPPASEPAVAAAPPAVTPVAAPEPPAAPARAAKKPRNMRSRLRDLLGFANLSAKALAGFPQEDTPPTAAAPEAPAPPPAPAAPAAPDTLPAANAPDTRTPSGSAWPLPGRASGSVPAPDAHVWPAAPLAPQKREPDGEVGHSEVGTSRVLGRPTGLRTNIEKVSIESLISAEFRDGTAAPEPAESSEAGIAAEPPMPELPASAAEPAEAPEPMVNAESPALPPLADDPEFDMGPAEPRHSGTHERARVSTPEPTSKIVPLPTVPRTPVPEIPVARAKRPLEPEPQEDPEANVDPEAFARATEDFMRSSPVLGASSRRQGRGFEVPGFGDPDAIAVASMVNDLSNMAVPNERQPEVRARLMDLARRLERGDLDWASLRKAVWFAMEFPELARRLMPTLLPWIDRAA